jgi:transcription factor IIIB 90 kDa subunit
MVNCKYCGGTVIEQDPQQGTSFCTHCGCVIEENAIVSDVTFTETSGGQSVLTGKFVPATTGTASFTGPRGLYTRESREITLSNGRSKMQAMATALQLTPYHVDAAQRMFALAMHNNFIQGRKTQNVAAACLYIVCRRERTPHMLIDFSDVLQTNVYTLGNTFLKLCRLLNLSLPIIDPSLYIHRFASRLEFGNKTHMVALSALRLVARMKRDWIQIGRRPSGICGASLLISARLHGFRRTQKEIVQVVKICDVTLRKRLREFSETPSAKLTPLEFNSIDLEEECDPPAYRNTRKRHKGVHVPQKLVVPAIIDGEADTCNLRISDQIIEREIEATLQSEEFRELERQVEHVSKVPVRTPIFIEREKTPEELHATDDRLLEKEDLCDVDDDEMDEVMLDEEEIKIKTELWTMLNKDFLDEQEFKKKQAEIDRQRQLETNETKKPRKKRRETRPKEPMPSALEATQYVLQMKKPSRKINYEVLSKIFSEDPANILMRLQEQQRQQQQQPSQQQQNGLEVPSHHPQAALS